MPHLPGAGHGRLKPLVPGVQHAQPQAVGAEVFACPVCDVDKLRVDPVAQVQGEDGREWDRIRHPGLLEDGVRVYLVADEMELVLAAEARDFLYCLDRLRPSAVLLPAQAVLGILA